MKEDRDIEKAYPKKDFVAKLRRLADAIENDKRFEIQIAGEIIAALKDKVAGVKIETQGWEHRLASILDYGGI